jgi:hypothetical protein
LKRLTSFLIGLGLVVLSAAPASAAGSLTVTITETSACTFRLDASWSGLGGGSSDTVYLVWYNDETGSPQSDSDSPVSGRSGSFSSSRHITGETFSAHHYGVAYLVNKGGHEVHGSLDQSDVTPSLETCA